MAITTKFLLMAGTRATFLLWGLRSKPSRIFLEPSESSLVVPNAKETARAPATLPASSVSGTSQLTAAGKACLPCGNDHFSTAAGALSESIRFAREGGVEHPEVIKRITLAQDELNAFERIDGSPENVVQLPPQEKTLLNSMLVASRDLRHHITDIDSVDGLEKAAALARQNRIEFLKQLVVMKKSGGK